MAQPERHDGAAGLGRARGAAVPAFNAAPAATRGFGAPLQPLQPLHALQTQGQPHTTQPRPLVRPSNTHAQPRPLAAAGKAFQRIGQTSGGVVPPSSVPQHQQHQQHHTAQGFEQHAFGQQPQRAHPGVQPLRPAFAAATATSAATSSAQQPWAPKWQQQPQMQQPQQHPQRPLMQQQQPQQQQPQVQQPPQQQARGSGWDSGFMSFYDSSSVAGQGTTGNLGGPTVGPYAPPFHQQAPQQQQPQQAYGQQAPVASGAAGNDMFGVGNIINEFSANPAAQFGVQLGNRALQQVHENVNQNLSRWIDHSHLKSYFNVSTSYVFTKIRLLLFPFRHTSWTRLVRRSTQSGQNEGHRPPREDLNAPDLYIPLMSLVTYVLLIGLQLGLQDVEKVAGSKPNGLTPGRGGAGAAAGLVDPSLAGTAMRLAKGTVAAPLAKSFSPDVLGITLSTAVAFSVVEVLILLFSFYLMSVHSNALILDLVSYTGYKFIAVTTTVLFKIIGAPRWLIASVFFYTMISLGFFIIRTLKYILLPENINPIALSARQRRIHFLFIIVLLEIFISWILVGYI